jgi:hypothetical protein
MKHKRARTSLRKIVKIYGSNMKDSVAAKNAETDPSSIIERYRMESGSLRSGDAIRLQNSISASSVIAESNEQSLSEQHLKNNRSYNQTDRITVALECFMRMALPQSGFSKMLEAMNIELAKIAVNRVAVDFSPILPEE